MSLRLAELADVPAVDSLARACGLSVDTRRELALPHSELWVSEEQGELVGLGLAWFVADELEVVDIAVKPERRRSGRGAELLDRLLARATVRGAQVAFLEVRAGNHAAQALYWSRGFVRDGERRGYYADGEDAWLFRRCLAAGRGSDSR